VSRYDLSRLLFLRNLLKEIESWESFDLHAVSQTLVFGGINLSNGTWIFLSREDCSGTLVLGGQFLAVTTKRERFLLGLGMKSM